MTDILEVAREQVLERGEGLREAPGARGAAARPTTASTTRSRSRTRCACAGAGPEVEVEGIVSLKTGGCPEDCHFCSQSGRFETPGARRAARHPLARRGGAPDRGDGRDRVLHRRRRARARRAADGAGRARASRRSARRSTSTSPARWASSPASRPTSSQALGVHRYNHNLETARSHFRAASSPRTPGRSAGRRSSSSASSAWRSAAAGIIGMGETLEQRAELAAQLADARARRGAAELPRPAAGHAVRATCRRSTPRDALRAIAAFRLALPRTVLRFAGGRELTLGDLGARQGVLGGINAIIVGNYLTTLGPRPAGGPRPARRARRCRSRRCRRRCERRGLHCDGCGRPRDEGDHARCRARRAATDPPRFCTACGRKLVVQVLPTRLDRRACVRCGPLPPR